jgi:hypothetical protein
MARRRCVSVLAARLAPYIREWQWLGLPEREIVHELNRCGAVAPDDFNADAYDTPTPARQWTLIQYRRLLGMLEPRKRCRLLGTNQKRAKAFEERSEDLSHSHPVLRGAGLFAHPQLAPLPAFNVRDRKFEPGEPKDRYSQGWFDWVLARPPHRQPYEGRR